MEYNSQRELLIISEYGRNVQKMVDYAKTLKSKDERTKVSKSIIKVMAVLSPQSKDVTDYEQKLWNHLFHIANYGLEIDCPYPIPTQAAYEQKPDRIPYPNQKIRYKHYGNTLELMIKAAIDKEEGREKNYLIECIANLMKKFYLSWNQDSVNDQVIIDHLKELSGGKLQLRSDFMLTNTQEIIAKAGINQKKSTHTHNNNNNKRHKNNKHKNSFKRK